MTALRLLLGVGLLGIGLGPVIAAAWALRERLLGWSGVPARLVEAVLALSIVIVVSEIVGVADLYRVAPMIVGLAAAGGLGWWWARREPGPRVSAALADGDRGPGATLAASQLGTWGRVLTVVVVAVVVADWVPRVAEAYRYGMLTIDTLWYHMPMTTRWVQLGSIRHVQYFDSDAVTAFYPANSELVHGLGILSLGSDILSPLLDLVWLGLALVAAWAIGRRYRVAPVTLAGAALLFATPGLVGTQPGGAYTDVVSIGLLLTTFAILVEAHRQEEPPLVAYGVAALAAGLAVGTKFTMLPAVGALTIAVVVVARHGARVRTGLVWVLGLFVTGGFWYVRNLVAVGNPLPSLGLHLGPITFRNLTNEAPYIGSVSRYVFDPSIWRQYLVPGLDGSLGWAWWALLRRGRRWPWWGCWWSAPPGPGACSPSRRWRPWWASCSPSRSWGRRAIPSTSG